MPTFDCKVSARMTTALLLLTLFLFNPQVAGAATINVPADGNLQSAINQAQPGDTISVQAGATFTGPFTLTNKGSSTDYITIQSSAIANLPVGQRVSSVQAQYMPKLVAASNYTLVVSTSSAAHHWKLLGLEIRPTSSGSKSGELVRLGETTANSLSQVPHHIDIDRCYIHAFPGQNFKRGITLNSADSSVSNSYIAEIHSTTQQTIGIGGWNGPGPFTITNNRIEAAGENILFGGAAPAIPDLIPSDITITGNYLHKPLAWRTKSGRLYDVENLLELKSAQRVLIDSNYLENNWVEGGSQHGAAVLFSVRNDDGGAPWSAIKDVQFTNNIIRNCPRGMQVLGHDQRKPSGTLERVTVGNNLWLIGASSPYSKNFLQINNGAIDMTVDHNTIFHEGEAIVMVNANDPSPDFNFTNNILKHNNTFVWYIEGDYNFHFGATGVFRRNVIVGGISSDVPNASDNFTWPLTMEAVGFVDLAGGNYRLASSSPFKGRATDGSDVGCNIDALADAEAARF
jgi:hypothetical protein